MKKLTQQKQTNKGIKIGIVAAKFNEFVTTRLLNTCLEELLNHGVSQKNITVVWVPGSFDIPVVALRIAKRKDIDAVICLGAVIRGETYHFELVAQNAARGIAEASLVSGKPVIFGVITTDTVDQAMNRSKEKGGNKGKDAAMAAIEMVNLLSRIK